MLWERALLPMDVPQDRSNVSFCDPRLQHAAIKASPSRGNNSKHGEGNMLFRVLELSFLGYLLAINIMLTHCTSADRSLAVCGSVIDHGSKKQATARSLSWYTIQEQLLWITSNSWACPIFSRAFGKNRTYVKERVSFW